MKSVRIERETPQNFNPHPPLTQREISQSQIHTHDVDSDELQTQQDVIRKGNKSIVVA